MRSGCKPTTGLELKTPATLSLAVARRILSHQIKVPTVSNTLLTCHACSDPPDKGDNDKVPLVSIAFESLIEFLARNRYICTSGGQHVFTAKAKRSKYYEFDTFEHALERYPLKVHWTGRMLGSIRPDVRQRFEVCAA